MRVRGSGRNKSSNNRKLSRKVQSQTIPSTRKQLRTKTTSISKATNSCQNKQNKQTKCKSSNIPKQSGTWMTISGRMLWFLERTTMKIRMRIMMIKTKTKTKTKTKMHMMMKNREMRVKSPIRVKIQMQRRRMRLISMKPIKKNKKRKNMMMPLRNRL